MSLASVDMGGSGSQTGIGRMSGQASGSAGSYLIAQFREFHALLVELRDLARQSGPARGTDLTDNDVIEEDASPGGFAPKSPFIAPSKPPPPPLPSDGKPSAPPLPNREPTRDIGLAAGEAQNKLQSLLERQALESGRRGGEYGVIFYRQAQYVMAVLADEVFLSMDWSGRAQWNQDLLETRLFGSYNAGDEFFRRADAVLKEGTRSQAELAAVFLLALSFGFRGRYRGPTHAGRLAEYKRQLYADIFHREPDLLAEARDLCPEAYAYTAIEAEPRMLPSPTRWFWVLGAVIFGYLVLGHLLWEGTVEPLDQRLAEPIPSSSSNGLGG